MDDRDQLLHRRLDRERLARKQAERIVEERSRELYTKGQELERTLAAERQALNKAEILREALEAFTSKLDRDEISGHLKRFLQRLIPHDTSAIYLPPDFPGNIEFGSLPIVIRDTKNDPRVLELGIPIDGLTCMVVPMSAHGRNVGCLTLGSSQEDAFDESAARLAQVLANEAAIALENTRLFHEVERLSTVDPLTGLHNRRHFSASARVEFERSRRYRLDLSAIMMDIDHFKRVNDTFGHTIGDQVLVEVAGACMNGIRPMDLHARYGGEEFCFILPETGLNGAVALAERLRVSVAGLHFETEGKIFTVTASFGVAERQADDGSVEDLLERSDKALYEAKREGRNRVVTR